MNNLIMLSTNLSLYQIKAWSYMYFRAFDGLKNRESFNVTSNELKEIINYKEEADNTFNKSIEGLIGCIVKWKSTEVGWQSSSLISYLRIEDGVCIYQFSSFFKEMINSPEIYTKLNMLIQNQFSSKHSRLIYGICIDYFNLGNKNTEVTFTVKHLRELLGLDDNEYPVFGELNRTILKKAVEEINDKSNLLIDIKYIKEKKNVVKIKFDISINKGNLLPFKELTSAPIIELETEPERFNPKEILEPILEKHADLRNFIEKHRVSTNVIENRIKVLVEEGIRIERISDYLLYIKSICLKNLVVNAPLFLNTLTQKVHIENFIQKLSGEDMKKEERYRDSLYVLYKAHEVVKVIEFLKDKEALFNKLLESNKNNLVIKTLRNSLTQEELVNSFGIAQELTPQVKKLEGFDNISFENWKADNMNKTILDKVKDHIFAGSHS